jgi:hypothetical protein
MLAALVVVGVSFVLVGRHTAGTGETFNWEVGSIFGTAVGTTLLAFVTGLLALSTWQDVRASQIVANAATEQLNQSRSQHREQMSPVVIGGLRRFSPRLDTSRRTGKGNVTGGAASVIVQNVGGGPAVRITVGLVWAATGYVPEDAERLSAEEQVIPSLTAGESTQLEFHTVGRVPESVFRDEDFWVVGTYFDRHGTPGDPIRDWNRVDEDAPQAAQRNSQA